MKIAIYGDSYSNGFVNDFLNKDRSWAQILYLKGKNKEDAYDLTNYGHRGSSLYYSYTKFFETHRDFDKVIFFVTFPSRLYLNSPLILDEQCRHINGIDTAARLAENYSYPAARPVFKAAYDYYLHIHDPIEDGEYAKLMLANLKTHRPRDCLFIINEMITKYDDCNFYGVSLSDAASKHYDIRHCHMSAEKHIFLAEEIDKFLKEEISEINYEELKNINPKKAFNEYFLPVTQTTTQIQPRMVTFDQHMNLIK